METNKYPIRVEAMHYDMIPDDTEPASNVQVVMNQVESEDPQFKEEVKKGTFFEIKVMLDVDQPPFKAQAIISRVVQIIDYFDIPDNLPPEELQKLSRPLVEYFETLVYQITAVALNKGVSLNFEPEIKEPAANEDEPTKNEK